MIAKILVVDDNPDIAGMLSILLSLAGHETQVATNGEDALGRLAEHDFDVIISDVMMPQLDGAGLWRELGRRHPQYTERMIFMTGAQDPSILAFLDRVAAPVLWKPFTIGDVTREVELVLDAATAAAVSGGGSAGSARH
jgi:CheY-like chemotaxis protein